MSSDALAILGGDPIRDKLLPYGRQEILEEDIAAVVAVLRSDWITTGPKVTEFEERFAAYVGAKHAVAYSSGTAALHACTFAAQIGAADEVITSPLTFCASGNCVLYQGGQPVFADIDPATLNIDPERVAAQITSRTRALLPVDYAGQPADLTRLRELADQHGLLLIEDAAHAVGAELHGNRIGTISDLTTFSFHPVKHLTTAEGGMVTTNSDELAARLRRFRNHGISSEARDRHQKGQWHYEMIELGFNYRLPDVACALGIEQLRRIDDNVARRRAIWARYEEAFAEIPEVITVREIEGAKSSWHLYPVRIVGPGLQRSDFFPALRAENIGVNVHYIPVPLHPYYQERFGDLMVDLPETAQAYDSLVSLPMFHSMTDADVDDVVRAVRKVIAHYRG